jgi:hypothetical protein
MAQTLSKTGIANNSTIQAWQVSQSIDALTGQVAYDITISGSLTLTGSVSSQNGFTGSLKGTADTSSVAQSAKVTNNATTNQSYRLLFVAENGLPNPNADGYAQPRFDSGSDGSGLYYNPSTNTLNLGKISGSNDGSTPDFVGTASYAATASIAQNAVNVSNYIPSFIGIDNVTYTSSNPYVIGSITPNVVYISSSIGSTLGLNFTANGVTEGKQVTLTFNYQNGTLDGTFIAITASTANVYGIGGQSISTGNNSSMNTGLGIGNASSLTFQFINSNPPMFPSTGWYLSTYNQS